MNLFYRELGEGQPLIILHGLFGSSDNWYSLSKVFAEHYRVLVVDQRNHGQSPHDHTHNYKVLTEDLHTLIVNLQLQSPIVLGHSMGGKTAMNFAVKYPDLLSRLIVVDIVPKTYPIHHDMILQGLKAIDLAKLESRGQADQILSQFVHGADVRQFLLKNLSRDANQNFEWKINLPVLDSTIEDMGEGMQFEGKFEKPSLFVLGSKSNYFAQGDERTIHGYFPNAKIEFLETGHWVQAEKPQEFTNVVLNFLRSTS